MKAFYIIIIISIIIIIDGLYSLYLRKPKFRIVRMKISKAAEKVYHPLRYRIEQQQVLLFGLIRYWSTPEFAPPHLFEKPDEAFDKIIEEVGVGNCIIIIKEDKKMKLLKRSLKRYNLIDIIKRLFCKHDYRWVRNTNAYEISYLGGKRSVWKCTKCGMVKYDNHLYKETEK